MSGMRSEPHLEKKSRTKRHHLLTGGANVQSVEETEPVQPASVNQDVPQVENECSFHDKKHKNPRGSRAFAGPSQCDESSQTKKTPKTRLVLPGPDGDVIQENKPKEHKVRQTQTPSSSQQCPQRRTSSSNQRFWSEDNNAEIFSNQPKEPSQTSRTEERPNDTSPSRRPKLDLNEDGFRDGSEDQSSGRGDHDDRSPSVLIQTFTNRIILEELLRRFLKHENFADEILQTFPEMSESLHWRISGLQETRRGSLNESSPLDEAAHMSFKGAAGGEPTPETMDRPGHPTTDASMESTNKRRKDIPPRNDQEHPKDLTKPMMTATDSDVQPTENRRSTETEHFDDFIFVDFYCTEQVQTRSGDPRGKTSVKHWGDVDQIPMGNPKASTKPQSSKFRRGDTAVPDWSSGGGTAEGQRIDESMGLNGLTDSCEEADEEVAPPQDHEPAPEVQTKNVRLRTRDKPKGNCRIS